MHRAFRDVSLASAADNGPLMRLRDDVFVVPIEADLAVLDVQRDQYFCLTQGLGQDVGFDADQPQAWSRMLAGRLSDLELLTASADGADRVVPDLPRQSCLHDPLARRPGLQDVLIGLRAVYDVRRQAREPGLCPLLSLAPRDQLRRSAEPRRVIEAARTFFHLLPWLPIDGACLVRSAVLMRYLNLQGLQADWVFGVRLWPFSAHCWVQVGDVCLNDDAERLIGFTAILRR